MFGRRTIRAALFVDFDNVVGTPDTHRLGDYIAQWTQWLESGTFARHDRRPRQIVARRVYWNTHNDAAYRQKFEEAGFEAISCVSRTRAPKSAADMMIAVDAMAMAYATARIREYIVLTMDTDFVALFDHLRGRGLSTVGMARDQASQVAYADHADEVIDAIAFGRSFKYERPTRWTDRVRGWFRPAPKLPAPPAEAAPPKAGVSEAKEATPPKEKAKKKKGKSPTPAPAAAPPWSAEEWVPAAVAIVQTFPDGTLVGFKQIRDQLMGRAPHPDVFDRVRFRTLMDLAALRHPESVRRITEASGIVHYRVLAAPLPPPADASPPEQALGAEAAVDVPPVVEAPAVAEAPTVAGGAEEGAAAEETLLAEAPEVPSAAADALDAPSPVVLVDIPRG